jgi:hypothetical protein
LFVASGVSGFLAGHGRGHDALKAKTRKICIAFILKLQRIFCAWAKCEPLFRGRKEDFIGRFSVRKKCRKEVKFALAGFRMNEAMEMVHGP